MDFQFSNCSTVDLNKINFIFCGVGAICCLVSAIILALIVIYKAFNSVLQRFFLYLMVAVFVRELFMVASFEHHFRYNPILQEKVCTGIGFIWNWTGILVFAFTVGMKVHLLLYAHCTAQGKTGSIILNSKQGQNLIILEASFVVFTIIITLLYSSVPFYTNNYGLAGPWCWIRVLDANCSVSTSGVIHQMLNGYIFYVSGSVIGLVLLIATVVLYCRLPIAYNNENTKMLLKKTFCVIITFLINIVMMVFALLVRVFAMKDKNYNLPVVWYIFGIIFPISLLLFPIVYMICFFRPNKSVRCRWCGEHTPHKNARFKPVLSVEQPTNRPSIRVSAPSETRFTIPFTDGFTQCESQDVECEMLVVNLDGKDQATGCGYGSTNNADASSNL